MEELVSCSGFGFHVLWFAFWLPVLFRHGGYAVAQGGSVGMVWWLTKVVVVTNQITSKSGVKEIYGLNMIWRVRRWWYKGDSVRRKGPRVPKQSKEKILGLSYNQRNQETRTKRHSGGFVEMIDNDAVSLWHREGFSSCAENWLERSRVWRHMQRPLERGSPGFNRVPRGTSNPCLRRRKDWWRWQTFDRCGMHGGAWMRASPRHRWCWPSFEKAIKIHWMPNETGGGP